MRKGLLLVAWAAASVGSATAARAEIYQVPSAYAIPLPPVLEPRFEVGMRYWQSVGSTHFTFNSSKVDPTLGNPTSVLKYDNMDGYSGEFFWYARNETDTFAKGFIGGGGLSGGSLDDEDYSAGQVKFPTRSARSRARV